MADPDQQCDPSLHGSSRKPPETREAIHQGHTLEEGLLARVREWVDLLPALRLLRTLRAAGSPTLLLVTWATFFVWSLGIRLSAGTNELTEPIAASPEALRSVSAYLQALVPTTLFHQAPIEGWWSAVGRIVWSLFVWAAPAMLLTRQGALLTAGRTMTPFVPGITLALRRAPQGWIAAVVPLGCLLPMCLTILLLGWLSATLENARLISAIIAVVAAVCAIPCGILAFGSNVAIPISWAALINQNDSDPLDALSRGYEYLFRRPVHLILYLVIAAVLMAVVGAIVSGVAWSASTIAETLLAIGGGSETTRDSTGEILWRLPQIAVLTMFWNLIGGIYLLLRYDAGNQEIDDLWQPELKKGVPLPALPQQSES